jgi:hypothetical protein
LRFLIQNCERASALVRAEFDTEALGEFEEAGGRLHRILVHDERRQERQTLGVAVRRDLSQHRGRCMRVRTAVSWISAALFGVDVPSGAPLLPLLGTPLALLLGGDPPEQLALHGGHVSGPHCPRALCPVRCRRW